MKLLEYKAQELFNRFGISGLKGIVVKSIDGLDENIAGFNLPAVIKAQVQTGGRGKAGGIKAVTNRAELISEGKRMFDLIIKNQSVKALFITDKEEIATEYYASIILDRKSKTPLLIFSSAGGMEINEITDADPDKVVKIQIDPLVGVQPFMIQYIIDKTDLDQKLLAQLESVIRKMYTLFCEYDCLLVEINPLAIDRNGNLKALDGKIEVDDNSLFRHQDMSDFRDEICDNPLVKEARAWNFLYIPVQDIGDIAVISNGSGMIMSCIDLLAKRDLAVTCALDLGGGATADRVSEAIRIVLSNPRVHLVFMNIFGGITRCDEIANGAKNALMGNPKTSIVIRMEGTNKEKGIEILNTVQEGIIRVEGLLQGVDIIHKMRKQRKQ